jgi:predicted nicotinamide N-methyase
VLDNPDTVRGLRVLDFAAGGGVSAIAAAMAGASFVLGNDVDPYAAAAVELNARLNGVAIAVSTENLVGCPNRGWDVLIAGDVCYERPMSMDVEAWLRGLAADGTLVLIGDPGRTYLPRTGLVTLATYDVPTSTELEDTELRRTGVLRVAATR